MCIRDSLYIEIPIVRLPRRYALQPMRPSLARITIASEVDHGARSVSEVISYDRHRRRAGRALGWLLPGSAGSSVRDSRRQSTRRRRVAPALGLTPTVYA